MRKYSDKYKIWHDNRCRKLAKKHKTKKQRRKHKYSHFKPKEYLFEAPKTFSIINNRTETERFFSDIIKVYNSKEKNNNNSVDKIFLDLSKTEVISPEAIMYLIAIVKNIKRKISQKLDLSGNFPENEKAKKLLFNSGFLNYVNSRSKTKISPLRPTIQIFNGNNVDSIKVSKVIDFVKEHSSCDSSSLRNLYTMLIEIMTNTVQHAYNNKNNIILRNWYMYIDVGEKVNITILDTGEGIPKTASKKFFNDAFLNLFSSHKESNIISTALDGEFRTETKKKYRGKGLPHILENFKKAYIDSLCIVSGKGSVILNRDSERKLHDSEESLLGTIFQISI